MITQIQYDNVNTGSSYSIPFSWLDDSQVLVYGDLTVLTQGTHYTLDSENQQITPLNNYDSLIINRDTVNSGLSYNFRNSKSLRSDELQEAIDIAKGIAEEGYTQSLKKDPENSGNYNAGNKKIINVVQPEDPADAVNKASLDSVRSLAESLATQETYIIDGGTPDSDTFERTFDGGGAYSG